MTAAAHFWQHSALPLQLIGCVSQRQPPLDPTLVVFTYSGEREVLSHRRQNMSTLTGPACRAWPLYNCTYILLVESAIIQACRSVVHETTYYCAEGKKNADNVKKQKRRVKLQVRMLLTIPYM